MSYILDALKKADRERTAGHVPDLETVHWREPAQRKPYRWLWVLAALFLFNGVAVTLLAIRHGAGGGEETVKPRGALDERGSALPDAAGSKPPGNSTPAVRKPPAKVARTPAQPQERDKVVVAKPASPVAQAPITHDSVIPPQVAVTPPVPAPEASPPPRPAVAPAQPSAASKVPEWEDLPLDFRSGFTMLRLDVHVYDTDPQRRFVLIDLQKYREGDRLPNGVVLEKILPDGIQLSYQGVSFHYGK